MGRYIWCYILKEVLIHYISKNKQRTRFLNVGSFSSYPFKAIYEKKQYHSYLILL